MPQELRFNLPPEGYEDYSSDSIHDVRLARLTKADDLLTVLVGIKKIFKYAAGLKEIYPNSILVGKPNISLPEHVTTVSAKIIDSLESKIREQFPDRKLLRTIAVYPYPVPEKNGVCNHTMVRIAIGTTDRINSEIDNFIGKFGQEISEIYTVKSIKENLY